MWKVSSLARSAVNTAGPGAARVLGGRLYSQDAPSGVPYKSYEAGASGESVPAHADVVIVGGGVAGCSTLYHLAKYGVTNAVLLEQHALTAGTTWHTAGLVWSLRPSDLDVELLNVSKNLMTSLEAETGVHPGWINNGGLFVASNKERLDEYKRLAVLGKAYGVDSEVLGPEETKKLYPLMNVDDVYGTLYSPTDGTIDPAQYCDALTRAARKNGAKVIQGCNVTNVQVKEDDYGTKRVIGVETDRGTIKTNCVVNAAGVWSPHIGDMANVKVPLIALRHAYVVTETIDGIRNMPNVRDHDGSLYLKLQGDTLCVGGYEPNPIFWDDVPKDFAFSLVDLDWDVFLFNMEAAMKRVPVIETTGIRSTVCGPESFTPDHKPLLGESPEVRGFYFGCAFNSSGMMLSGGVGSELAKWIINGKPDLDMYSYDIRRFTTRLTNNKKWLKERSQEAYAKNYSIVFPHDEPLASRNMRKDALYDVLRDAGCVFQERQGWERPGWFTPKGPSPPLDYDYYGFYDHAKHEPYPYSDRLQDDYTFDFPAHHDIIGKDCLTCRESAAVFDMSYFGKFYLVGPDAQKAVDWIFSNDLQKPTGSTVYTCMLNKNGGVESDLTVSVLESGSGGPHAPSFEGRGFYVAIGGAVAQYGYSHMLDIIQDKKWDCQIVDHSDDMCLISVQGPQSRNILQQLTDTDLNDEAFPFSTHKVATMAGHEVRALRLSFVGELGWEIHVSNASSVPVYEAIMEAGRQHGVCNAGYRAIDALSIEKGYRHWHADLRADDTPLEAGLAFTCKLKTDIDFLGRSAIEAQKKAGMKKRIACFTLDKHVRLQGLETIYRDNVPVGFLRRADYAHAMGKSIGYGYVKNPEGDKVTLKYIREGSYTVDVMGERVPANVHTKTPFDPDNKRVKGIYDEPLPIHC